MERKYKIVPNLDSSLIDKIVKKCFNLYNILPKTGKPIEKEWTVLSCVVKYDSLREDIEVVSLGTGSKCIGATKMSPKGDVLNDSHAEVFARRGFLVYLYDNLEKALKNELSVFTRQNAKFQLKNGVTFFFFSSQLPCGDASIIPKDAEEVDFGDILKTHKRLAVDTYGTVSKKPKIDDIHRTGAKCLSHSQQDSKDAGSNYHILGQVRTKPGRGDRTLSVSCSDKMSKWIHLGIHGSLLDMLIEPIYIEHFIFGAGVPYSEESLNRALLTRNTECCIKPAVIPMFYQSSLKFISIRTNENNRPAPGSIVWIKLDNQLHEVSVHGRKLGVTKKNASSLTSSLCVSKYNMYKIFLDILQCSKELKKYIIGEEDPKIPYNKMKRKSLRYLERWNIVKSDFFKTWTLKPDIWDFCVINLKQNKGGKV